MVRDDNVPADQLLDFDKDGIRSSKDGYSEFIVTRPSTKTCAYSHVNDNWGRPTRKAVRYTNQCRMRGLYRFPRQSGIGPGPPASFAAEKPRETCCKA